MKDFIINLYANKYFPIYLGVIIFVLLVAFFIVFFLGKKDQKKILETQKLNLEKLKESQNNPAPANNEVNSAIQSIPVQNSQIEPKEKAPQPVNTASIVKPVTVNQNFQTPVTPVVEPVKVQPSTLASEVKNEVDVKPVEKVAPIIPPVMEVPVKPAPEITKPVIDEDVYKIKKEEDTVNRLKELSESLDKEVAPLLPKEEAKKEINNTKVVSNIYSSVYVPNKDVKEENTLSDDFDDTMNIELPKLKTNEPVLKDDSQDTLNLL